MKLVIIAIIILLLVILVINKKNENFIDEKTKAKILRGIDLNMGEIENINSLKISSIPDSEKLLLQNIIKNYTVKNLIFKKNLELVNYTNIIGPDGKNANPNKMELVYDKRPMENIHNLPVCSAVGPDFKTNENNPYYGVQMKYRIHDNSFANRAEIGIEYKSYKDISLGKLMEMNNRFNDEDYKKMKRKRVEAIGPDTKKFEFLPYFRDSDIEALLLFKDSKNEDFLEESGGYFNLNDERGNRILTKCKIDNPYCNVHLPQKGKIYGRDNYIATKFYPYNDNFRVIVSDKINDEELKKIKEQIKKANEEKGPNGVRIGPNGEIIGPNGEIIVPRGGRIGPNGEIIGPGSSYTVTISNEEFKQLRSRPVENCALKILYNGKLYSHMYGCQTIPHKTLLVNQNKEFVNYNNEVTTNEYYIISNFKKTFFNIKSDGVTLTKISNNEFTVSTDDLINSKKELGNSQYNFSDVTQHLSSVEFRNNTERDNNKDELKNRGIESKVELNWNVQRQEHDKFKITGNNIFAAVNNYEGELYISFGTQTVTKLTLGPNGLAISYFNFAISTDRGYNEPDGENPIGSFIEKQIHNGPINFDWTWYEENPENKIIIRNKSSNVYLLIEGFIKAPKNGNVVFKVTSDDGVRIDIAGETQLKNEEGIVADTWKGQPPTPYTTNSISMKKDNFYKLKIEYYAGGGGVDSLKLEWKWDGDTEFQVVPANVFFTSRQNSEGAVVREGFVGDFQDTSELPKEDQLPPLHDFYKKYLTKKDCVNEKEKLIRAIKDDRYLEEKEVNLVASKEELESLQRLRGSRCIKHFDDLRDDYFFGGFDKDNKMFCYGKDQDCIMFPSKKECEKMDLNTLLSIPEEELVKGLKYNETRNLYDDETMDMLTEKLKAEKEEKKDGYEVKCGTGKYLEGTFNPEDEIQIVGGYFKDCTDPQHPDHDNCPEGRSPSTSYHLSELITTKGRKKYDPSKTDKYSNFGDLDGECIENNLPEGRMEECDPLDDFQPCYVGNRPGLVPGESVSNSDRYNKYLGYNCHTYTLPTNTCKHNNQGILSDVISFTNSKDKDYLDLINNQKILEMSQEYDFNMLNDEEKYRAKNLFLFMEKYFERYEDMNPRNHMNLRYSMKFDSYYDLITKRDEIILNIYYKGVKEATLNTNQGEIHYLQDGDIIEILIQKDNHLIFKVINPATKLVSAQYVTKEKIEGKYGSDINFFISQNNNSFLRDIKYKEEIPKMVLPYNPFIDITQL